MFKVILPRAQTLTDELRPLSTPPRGNGVVQHLLADGSQHGTRVTYHIWLKLTRGRQGCPCSVAGHREQFVRTVRQDIEGLQGGKHHVWEGAAVSVLRGVLSRSFCTLEVAGWDRLRGVAPIDSVH